MAATIKTSENGTIQLTITIPWDSVKKAKEVVVNETTKNANIKGFRKGKAPKTLVEENINPAQVQEDVLKKLLPEAYIAAIQEHKLKPILNPKIHVEKYEDGKDWTFLAETCEMPEVKIGNYKDEIKKVTAKSKIIIPGKEPQEPNFDDIMKTLLDSVIIKIPQMLISHESDRLLSQTLDEIKRLGLTLDQYLASTKKTPEELRKEYEIKAANDMKIEFTLAKIAEIEKITVEDKEIEEAIQKAKNPEERTNLEANKYLLASIIRQQKTLDFLKYL